jgi:RimJ/RimL family protein N-acetyltransferase
MPTAIEMRRRALLLLAALPAVGWAKTAREANTLVAAWDDTASRHWVGLLRVDADPIAVIDAIEVPTRAHGLAALGDGSVLVVARRPGEWLLRWRPGAKPQWLWAPAERRFNGHALLHAHGVFTTETDLDSGQGLLVRRDARTLDAIDAWPTAGRDPHDLEALSDGSLLVANGGIDTAPETGRAKRHVERMDPSLVRIDARSGGRLGQWRLPDPRLSVRHLALDAASGLVGVALQAEHDDAAERAAAPVFALFDPAASSFVRVPDSAGGHGYAGDVAACASGWIVSRPRDDSVLLLPRAAAASPQSIAVHEGCALAADARDPERAWALGSRGASELPSDRRAALRQPRAGVAQRVIAAPALLTERLALRPFTLADASFIVELVNDADWLRFIGDRNVHSIADAQRYLREGPLAMQARYGHSLWAVQRRADAQLIGMCGLIRRADLDDVDIGYAFLPAHRGQGHAREAAQAVLLHGLQVLKLPRIVAITDPDNQASARVLAAIGMRFERLVHLPAHGGNSALYAIGKPAITRP